MIQKHAIFKFNKLKFTHLSPIPHFSIPFFKDLGMQKLCTAYVRYSDLEVPFRTQRSMVKVIFHLDRKGLEFGGMGSMVFVGGLPWLDGDFSTRWPTGWW